MKIALEGNVKVKIKMSSLKLLTVGTWRAQSRWIQEAAC